MDKQKTLVFILTAMLITSVLFTSGCVRGKPKPTQTTTTKPLQTTTTKALQTTTTRILGTTTTKPAEKPGLETCAELGGYDCAVGEDCEGNWLDASDTFSCCSKKCKSITKEGVLTLNPFDIGPENEKLGEVV